MTLPLPYRNRSKPLTAALAVLAALFAALACAAALHPPAAFEAKLMLWVHAHVGAWYAPVALALHIFGKTAVGIAFVAACVLALCLCRRWRTAAVVGLAPLLSTLNMLLVKHWVARERPLLWPRLAEEGNFSFPSGHSSFGAVWMMLLVLFCPPAQRLGATLFGTAFALLMGFSRVWLGVHYPSDVLAGWLNGAMFALLSYLLVFKVFPHESARA